MAPTPRRGPLSDAVITAMATLVDDSQLDDKRKPAHSDLEHEFKRSGLLSGDPKQDGKTVGKAKRVRAVLSWSMEHKWEAGEHLVYLLISMIRAKGGFRSDSPNFVGENAIRDAQRVFREEGFDLAQDGGLTVILLDSLSGTQLTGALRNYVNRAKRGAADAALVTGTGKDLVEAVAKHVLEQVFGQYAEQANFPTLLGQAFASIGLAHEWKGGDPAHCRVEAALYELGCAVNTLRSKQGTGHGRPFLPTVTDDQARTAIESMGIVAETLLDGLARKTGPAR